MIIRSWTLQIWYSFTIKSMNSFSGVEKVIRSKIDKLYVIGRIVPPKMCKL